MAILNRYNLSFFILILSHIGLLLYSTAEFSISYKEADIYFNQSNILHFLTTFSTSAFGQNDIALRLPFMLFYIGSAILLYLLTDDYFKKDWDRFICISIFMILPGVNSAALLINESILVVFFTLLYLYLYKLRQKEHYILLTLFLFIDNSFAILYLALFFYSIKKKDNILLVVSLVLFGLSMSIYGFEVGGRPRGYFLETFGIYASIFSPLLFLYFFYAMYRIGLKLEKDLYWYIAATALLLSLVFSLRQKIAIEDFAPFVVIAIPIMLKLFLHSLRVRLKVFREKHMISVTVVLSILVLNFLLFVFNKYIYLFLEKPSKHFAYNHHIAKDLAFELKQRGIDKIKVKDRKLALRLKYYGIKDSDTHSLKKVNFKNDISDIKIEYFNRTIERYNIIMIDS